jgi:hypothetical protein
MIRIIPQISRVLQYDWHGRLAAMSVMRAAVGEAVHRQGKLFREFFITETVSGVAGRLPAATLKHDATDFVVQEVCCTKGSPCVPFTS